jgi:flagellar protein FlaJ
MKSFLLRLSDAMRSGEPMADFLAREAEAQGEDYQNTYERNLEALKQWSNAFSSIVISVALIVIIQVISSMLYSVNRISMVGMIFAGLLMSGFGAWIIMRSAPKEIVNVRPDTGSAEQRRSVRLFRMVVPIGMALGSVFYLLGMSTGMIFMLFAVFLFPVGISSMISDRVINKKDVEFSTFLRSSGGMATSSGTTLKQALTKIDLTSFPALQPDIERLSTRLQALVEPDICWHKFGTESGSKLISEVVDIFYSAVKIGGDPERVGYLCSLFTAKTSQLRAKRRMITQTFAALTTVMQAVVSGIMVFVLYIVIDFVKLITTLMEHTKAGADDAQTSMSMSLVSLTPEDLTFLSLLTGMIIVSLAVIGASAIIFSDGGSKIKVSLYLSLSMFVSGLCYLFVPSMVAGILKV